MPKQYIDVDKVLSMAKGYNDLAVDDFAYELSQLPTADVVERKHGEWIPENRRPRSIMFYCSECHRTAYDMQGAKGTPKRCRYAWCPNCGADMRERREDGLDRQTGGD